MHISIKSNGFELTPNIKEYVNKKIGALEKFIPDYHNESVKINVEVGRSTFHHKRGNVYEAKVHIVMPRANIYTSAESEDIFSAIDLLENKVKNELLRVRVKKRDILIKSLRQIKKMIRFPQFFKRQK